MQKAERVKPHKRQKVRLLNWLFKALCNGIDNGLAFLLLDYPVLTLSHQDVLSH